MGIAAVECTGPFGKSDSPRTELPIGGPVCYGHQCVGRHEHCEFRAGIVRAGGWSGGARFAGFGLCQHGGHTHGHCAVMRSMAAATGWQGSFVATGQNDAQRPDAEQDRQQDGEPAPHLLIVAAFRRAQ